MELVLKKEECSGCSACMNICPKDAITMQADDEGFLYPQISKRKCIDCRLCEKVCFYKTGYKVLTDHLGKPEVYAAKHKDLDVRMASQSGGMFTAISDYVLSQNGVVYGAGYGKNFTVCHKRAETKVARDEFRGSKYVQSDVGNMFKKVKEDLDNNKFVLFSGTPCQGAGLMKFLEKISNTDKLLIVDILCHGVPSPRIRGDYSAFLAKKYKGEIQKVNFRDKQFGWHSHVDTVIIGGKGYSDIYYAKLFYGHYMLRCSCHNCKFTNLSRCSDITIGDCWGVENHMPQIDDNKGVSLLIVNTNKGEKILGKIKDNIETFEIPIDKILQPQLQYPPIVSPKRKIFWNDYRDRGFEYVLKKYAGYNLKARFKKKAKEYLKQFEIVKWLWQLVSKNILKT